ncbi:MAG: hypothetical protein ACK6CT_16040, partial [Planctomycetia bacterium]
DRGLKVAEHSGGQPVAAADDVDRRIDGGRAVVQTDAGAFTADRLVLCPGPWAGGLLRLPRPPLFVVRKSLFWYAPPGAAALPYAAG